MFDINTIEDYSDNLPEDTYTVVITDGIVRPSKNNPTTHLLELDLQLTDNGNDYDGWSLRHWFVIKHADNRWAKRGLSDLKNLMKMLSVTSFQDPEELVGLKYRVKTQTKDDFTTVKDFMPIPRQVAPSANITSEKGIPF